jgi:RNA polymerase sigma-70 factor (ECF subfamily)
MKPEPCYFFPPMASREKDAEIELARDLIAGNLGAFDRFVEAFHSRLFQYSMLVCGHPEDAEEVAQDTLLNVFKNFNQLREPEHVRAWIFRIARNACLMKRRKSVFAPAHELSLDELMPAAGDRTGERKLEIADWSALPDAQVLRAELKEALMEAIQSLPDLYKTVLLLRDVEELSTEETAGILDVSHDVVKTRLHRARLAVRQKLDGYLQARAN